MTMSKTDPLDVLATNLQPVGSTSDSYKPRFHNIKWIIEQERGGLKYQDTERQILFKTTAKGEMLFIQFPGKESEGKKVKRPWDFRPKVLLPDGKTYGKDASFAALWKPLYDELKSTNTDKKHLQALAAVFYRMAVMADHHLSAAPFQTTVRELEYVDFSPNVKGGIKKDLPQLYLYEPNAEVLSELSKVFTEFGGMSLEAFLHYNDLLAWNEDCKYYFNGEVAHTKKQAEANGKKARKMAWQNDTGRPNNILTLVSVMGYAMGHIHFADLLGRASNGRGVAPVSDAEALAIAPLYLKAQEREDSVELTKEML
jgi:hypothetical protein